MDSELNLLDNMALTPLKIISHHSGNIMHALKNSEDEFKHFGEAYFSLIRQNHIKGWKRHQKMTSNLIVPVGIVKFVLYDDRLNSSTYQKFFSINLSTSNYQRLTIPPMIWTAFQGVEVNTNLILNIADIPHDPNEVENTPLSDINYNWKNHNDSN